MDRVDAARSDFSGRADAASVAVAEPIARSARELQSAACVRAVKVSRAACVPFRPRPLRPVRWPLPSMSWVRDAKRPTFTSQGHPRRDRPAPRLVYAARRLNNTGGLFAKLQQLASLPVRTARLLQRSRTQTPSEGGASDGSASPAPASLLQDVVDIKTLLLQLKRVLQEPGDEHHSMSSETLDPLLAACAESPACGNGRRPLPHPQVTRAADTLPPDACAEMRRQILYLQGQLEERDRLVRVLQQQMLRMAENHEPRADDTCNVATQTDRLRPPMSTALTSSENSGLVSWNEQASARKLPSYSEAQKTKRPVANGTVKQCQCGARKANAEEPIRGRVGSQYLLAVAADARRYQHRDPDRTRAIRSRSIENFHNSTYQVYSNEPALARHVIEENSLLKHHTSYGDLYNGRIGSKESVNGNRHSPSLNGQSTDTDYSSDGGYKSLPSSINCGNSPKKVSGIPRRSFDQKFTTSKHVKASAI
ncbi:uncharacterized protein ACR2FA_011505 [Aphomia sociella]